MYDWQARHTKTILVFKDMLLASLPRGVPGPCSGWNLVYGHMFEPQGRKEIATLHAAAVTLIEAQLGPDGVYMKGY